ncbi:MAG TPA: FAD-linked oxidase C-terminal domain-containing protein [Pseudonocardiaceae bacterium]|nr:FAD-linked oxidase C-terminal domain-containing protein [Pseudonocardiaceae bacterium]
MDPSALLTELRAAGLSEVDISTRRRAEYSSDASLYRVVPTAVAFPRSTDEVLAALSACRTLGVPLTARGAGTSIAGNAVGAGLVLDFSRHLDRITALDPEAETATVQPGVILDDLQRAAAPHGLRFGPDPSTHSRATLGGMIGNNACGSRALGYGRTADNVQALDLVAGNGERINAVPGTPTSAGSPTLAALHELVGRELALIRTELGRFSRQVSGYSLEHLLPERGFHLPAALVGTEGSCGVLLGATVTLRRAPASTALVVLGYPDMASAADAVPALLPYHPIAMEGLDSRMVAVLPAGSNVPELPAGKGWLFVELDTTHSRDAIASVLADAGTSATRVVDDRAQAAALWRIREDGAGLAARANKGHAGWEDAAVPPERLGAYLREFESLLVDRGLTGVPYGHFGDGCVHIRIDFPLGTPAFREFLTDAATLVARYGGSCSGEHGDGRARGELLPLMYSPEVIDLFAKVKTIFDPDDLLNPGIVVRPDAVDAHLRIPAARRPNARLGLRLAHDDGDFNAAVHRCTGVGKCRADNTATGGVMCPSYLATRDEKDSTRGRARVLQDMLNGSLISGGWRAPEVHEALDLCLSCKGCARDCPTGIDMAAYKAEVLHQTYRHRIRPAAHYSLGALPRWARLAARAPRLANAAFGLRGLAALGKRLAGVDPRRDLPRFAPRTFHQLFAQHTPTSGDPILLWVDTFTNHFTPEVGVAAVRVLESAGYSVRVPEPGLCCGLTWISTGQLDAARRIVGRSVRALASFDMPVVGLEPSCTAVFRSDAAELLNTEVPHVSTLAEVLTNRPQWNKPDLSGLDVLAQPHCHQHAVLGFTRDTELLADAGANLTALGGCCGLAGNFGVERGHYDVSVAVAEHTLLPAVRAAEPATEVLADGFSCRTQLAELSERRGRHLAELLAERLG